MEITIQELYLLEQGSYQIIDIRNEIEVSHGRMPGAVHTTPDFIVENPDVDLKKKLVICCARGEASVEVAHKLDLPRRSINMNW